jgi:hypothetical protein
LSDLRVERAMRRSRRFRGGQHLKDRELYATANGGFGLQTVIGDMRGRRGVDGIDRVNGRERRQGGDNPKNRDQDKAAVGGWRILS